MLRLGMTVAIVLLLSSCAAPDTPPPAAAVVVAPAGWRTEPGTATLVDGWWRSFGDPALDGLVERALANNPDVGVAIGRVREARAQEALARSQLLPSLSLGASGGESRSLNAFGRPTEAAAAQPVFQAAYELDLFGRVADQAAAARLNAEASAAARDTVRLSVAAATAAGYITLRALDARLAIVRATAADRAEALRIARDRATAGYTSELELRQAEAEYRAATQLVPQAELAITRQEDTLRLLTGDVPGAVVRGLPLDMLAQPPVPGVLPADLLRRRPDIAQAELALAASDASLSAARKQFLPQINLAASAGAVLSSALGDPVTIWSVGGSILAPIFAGGRLSAGVEAAAGRRDQAAFAYRRTALTAFREVDDNLAALVRLSQQATELGLQRTAVADALRHAVNRYQAGYSSYLEQLDARRSLLSVDLSLVQLRADRLNAQVALYQAMGGGWPGMAAPSP